MATFAYKTCCTSLLSRKDSSKEIPVRNLYLHIKIKETIFRPMCTFACCAGVSFKPNTDSAKEIRRSSPRKSRVGSSLSECWRCTEWQAEAHADRHGEMYCHEIGPARRHRNLPGGKPASSQRRVGSRQPYSQLMNGTTRPQSFPSFCS